MQVSSPSRPKRRHTTRSSSLRMAWSTAQPLRRWGSRYDMANDARNTNGEARRARGTVAVQKFRVRVRV
jgi:hypothetical protein